MLHITALLEGNTLVATRGSETWEVTLQESLTGKWETRTVTDNQLGAILALAVSNDDSATLNALYPLAEQGLAGLDVELRPIP
jgi:hypothetical protein